MHLPRGSRYPFLEALLVRGRTGDGLQGEVDMPDGDPSVDRLDDPRRLGQAEAAVQLDKLGPPSIRSSATDAAADSFGTGTSVVCWPSRSITNRSAAGSATGCP